MHAAALGRKLVYEAFATAKAASDLAGTPAGALGAAFELALVPEPMAEAAAETRLTSPASTYARPSAILSMSYCDKPQARSTGNGPSVALVDVALRCNRTVGVGPNAWPLRLASLTVGNGDTPIHPWRQEVRGH